MATQNKIATIIDASTGQITTHALLGEELEAIETEQNRLKSIYEIAKAKEVTDAQAKAALLERLGISEAEAKLLLS
jgi:hypothetical protein